MLVCTAQMKKTEPLLWMSIALLQGRWWISIDKTEVYIFFFSALFSKSQAPALSLSTTTKWPYFPMNLHPSKNSVHLTFTKRCDTRPSSGIHGCWDHSLSDCDSWRCGLSYTGSQCRVLQCNCSEEVKKSFTNIRSYEGWNNQTPMHRNALPLLRSPNCTIFCKSLPRWGNF